MSIYWVRFQGESAADAMRAVADALSRDERGIAPVENTIETQVETPEPAPVTETVDDDTYLQTNLQTLHAAWSIDPLRPELPTDQRLMSRLRVHLQHLVRRLTRWYILSPWLQTNEFHAAIVRIIDVFLDRQQQMRQELLDCQYRLQAAEQQIHLLRNELSLAQQRIMELRQQRTRADLSEPE